jgi:hypothetical protein
MWKLDNGSYYKWEHGELTGSIIHCSESDGCHPNQYGIQIHTADGGLFCIGHILNVEFNPILVRAICDMALRENKDFDWWVENKNVWWYENVIRV